MGFLKNIQSKAKDLENKYKLNTQIKAEKQAKKLEGKVVFAKTLNKRLKRQEKAQKEIDKLQRTKERLKPKTPKTDTPKTDFFSGGINLQNKEPFFMNSQNKEPFFMNSQKKEKKKDILDQFL